MTRFLSSAIFGDLLLVALGVGLATLRVDRLTAYIGGIITGIAVCTILVRYMTWKRKGVKH